MSFDLVAYEKLKSSIEEAIETLIKHHKKEDLKDIPTERRVQAQVLLKTIELCDNIKASTDEARKKQATILNAAVYYIHQQIEKTYNYSSPRSNFYNSLTTCLNLNNENKPSQNELFDLFSTLLIFQREHLFINGDARKGFLANQPFDIKDYCAFSDNRALTTIVQHLECKILDDAQALHLKAQSQAKSKGFLSSLWSSPATESSSKEHGKAFVPM